MTITFDNPPKNGPWTFHQLKSRSRRKTAPHGSVVHPLLSTDGRHEFLTLLDGSKIEINRQMRLDHPSVYFGVCRMAASREFRKPNNTPQRCASRAAGGA